MLQTCDKLVTVLIHTQQFLINEIRSPNKRNQICNIVLYINKLPIEVLHDVFSFSLNDPPPPLLNTVLGIAFRTPKATL